MENKSLNKNDIFKILQANNKILQKYHVRKIGLFGSSLNNDNSESNDIDFLVEFEKTNFDDFMELSFSLEEIFHKQIDLVTANGLSLYLKPIILENVEWYEAK